MTTLIIDTSSEYCILALSKGDTLCAQELFLHENRLSQTLVPKISNLIIQAGSSLKELEQIAVGVGPGSYTGTRIGVAVARSLSYGLEIPLRGFCSLLAFLPESFGLFATVLAAKSGLFFLVTGEKQSARLKMHNAHLVTDAELKAALQTVDFITARNREELSSERQFKEFFTFCPNSQNIVYALQEPPQFSFETQSQLLYLHAP